jgi:hypothetical protein
MLIRQVSLAPVGVDLVKPALILSCLELSNGYIGYFGCVFDLENSFLQSSSAEELDSEEAVKTAGC